MLFPPRCPVCHGLGPAPCGRCRAASVPVAPGDVPPVAGVDRLEVCFRYEGNLRVVLTALKYRNNRAALGWLGASLAATAGSPPAPWDVVTWAPTTTARARRRGFDQSALLAAAFTTAAGLAPPRRLLCRRAGPAQTGRPGGERRGAVAFAPADGRGRGTRHGAFDGCRVLVVDDVITTGATLAAAAAALRSAGAGAVDGLVVAWTPPPGAGAPAGRGAP